MTLGEKITNLRESRGLSRYELADASGIAPQLIYRYESGDCSKLATVTIEKLAKALHVSPAYLMGWEAPREETSAVKVPVYSKIFGAACIPSEDDLIGYVTTDSGADLVAMKISGSEMAPDFHEGDTAIIHRQPDVESGDFAAVWIKGRYDGLVTVRKIHYSSGGMTAICMNEDFPPYEVKWTEREPDSFVIMGKVVEIRRRV